MCAEMMDVTRDEAKRILRRLELEAYSSIISAFRAQGDLSRSKKKILQELGTQLSISTERHRAEVRRAYSDDRLAVVAESVYGPGSCAEWAAEGKRLVPLMPRLVPQTVFSASATAAANTAAAANAKVLASSGSKASSSSTGVSSTAVSPSTVSSNGPTLGIQQSATKASNLKTLSQTGETQVNDTDSVDDDGKPKRRRRLSVSSLNKPVTKVTIPTPLVTKPLSKTTSVSTMTKAGKSLGPVGTVKAIPRISPLSASASQVKLLTKTVAVTQTVCQAKTLLSYKTLTSSPVKVQTVTTQSTPKTQTKVTPAMPPKVILASKTPSATMLKSVSTASTSSVVTTSPIPVTLKTTTLTAAQLAGRQRVKQATTRFKPLPGTVKFKTVTPATMGTCSTVTMVTPSPSSQASSALPVSGTQPVVRVIHVPGSGGVGVSKPVVVMTTGLGKSTIGGVLPGATTGATSKATSQVTHSSSAAKTSVSPASTLPSHMTTVQTSKTSSTVAQPIVTTPKTVVMTTLVGTKRVVLSVPAPLQVSTISSPTISSQGIGIVTSVGGGNVTPTTSSQLQSSAKKDILPSPLTTLCVTGSVGQLAPSHSTSTVTTQVRSRPLPALLPAPPKPYAITCSQTTTTSTPTTSGRKLPTLLPAPAKSMAVIPTVLVPVDTGVGSTTTGQVQPSVPVAGTPVVPEVDGPEVCLDSDAEHCCGVDIFAGQDCSQSSADPASLPTDQHVITTPQCLNKDVAWNKEGGHQFIVESPNLTNRNNIKSVPQYELSNVTDGDNNTSSEDDSLLMCSETIDNGCNLADTNARALDYLYSIGESTPIKPLVTDVEHVIKEVQPSLLASSDDHVSGTQSIAAEPRIDIEESDSRLQSLAIEKELTNDQENSLLSVGSLSKVTVERLDDTGGICDVVQSNLSHHLGTNSVDLVEQGKVCDAELHVDPAIHSVELNPIHEEEDQNFAKDERHTLPYQMENALKVITSFVESMEGGPLDKEENKTTNPLPQDLNSELQTTRSFPSENEDLPQVVLDVGCERNSDPSQDATASSSDHIQESSSNMLLKFPEDNWDAIGDASIDILSTSTSSCSSTPECSDVTDKDIKSLEAAAYVRTSGRKRKPPTSLEVSPSRQGSGWVRGALSLLQRVASYRGQGRRKGDFGAATWFLKPVDPVDAPGYYKVIKTPMDFGTIKIKLESGNYQQYSEFHSDMLLVKSNCLKYNPPGHDVRQDCDEVFKFYESEYTKMLERWEKCHVSPAKKPRVAAKAESAP